MDRLSDFQFCCTCYFCYFQTLGNLAIALEGSWPPPDLGSTSIRFKNDPLPLQWCNPMDHIGALPLLLKGNKGLLYELSLISLIAN